MKKILAFTIASCFLFAGFGQTTKEKEALSLGKEAIGLMDKGSFDESIKLLKKAIKLDGENVSYPYELAYAYYLKEDYQKAIKVAESLIDRKDAPVAVFQLLGNTHDVIGDPDKALETYKEGMKRFPESGNFYLESGVVESKRENFNEAITYWEAGIKVDPNYSSNYYQLAKIFTFSEERIWSMLYAEMFMNLEAGSKRTEEISALLLKNYQESYVAESDSSGEFSLTKKGFVIEINHKRDIKKKSKKGTLLPFEGTFAGAYALAAIGFHHDINVEAIVEARTNFVEIWFKKNGHAKAYPNALLAFQKKLMDAGHFETYSRWLISAGDLDAFKDWLDTPANMEKFKAFAEYLQEENMQMKDSDMYSRRDY